MTTTTYICEWCKTNGSKDPKMLCQFTTTAYLYDYLIERMACPLGDKQKSEWKLTNSSTNIDNVLNSNEEQS